MEELLNEEKEINKRIDIILDFEKYETPEIDALTKRIGELWDRKGDLSIEEDKELYEKSKLVSELRFKKSIEFRDEFERLSARLQIIAKEKFKLIPPIIVGERIGLKNLGDNICEEYLIVLNDTDKVIGSITYRGHHFSNFLADIGFTINPEYRGNGYAYEALCLLSDILYDNNIKDFWITAFKANTPSIKTIIKYGAKELSSDYDKVAFYECDTRKYIHNKEVKR